MRIFFHGRCVRGWPSHTASRSLCSKSFMSATQHNIHHVPHISHVMSATHHIISHVCHTHLSCLPAPHHVPTMCVSLFCLGQTSKSESDKNTTSRCPPDGTGTQRLSRKQMVYVAQCFPFVPLAGSVLFHSTAASCVGQVHPSLVIMPLLHPLTVVLVDTNASPCQPRPKDERSMVQFVTQDQTSLKQHSNQNSQGRTDGSVHHSGSDMLNQSKQDRTDGSVHHSGSDMLNQSKQSGQNRWFSSSLWIRHAKPVKTVRTEQMVQFITLDQTC